MNKAIGVFHILSILSVVDNNFDPREGLMFVKYLKETFPSLPIKFDDEIEVLSSLDKNDYLQHVKPVWKKGYLQLIEIQDSLST